MKMLGLPLELGHQVDEVDGPVPLAAMSGRFGSSVSRTCFIAVETMSPWPRGRMELLKGIDEIVLDRPPASTKELGGRAVGSWRPMGVSYSLALFMCESNEEIMISLFVKVSIVWLACHIGNF